MQSETTRTCLHQQALVAVWIAWNPLLSHLGGSRQAFVWYFVYWLHEDCCLFLFFGPISELPWFTFFTLAFIFLCVSFFVSCYMSCCLLPSRARTIFPPHLSPSLLLFKLGFPNYQPPGSIHPESPHNLSVKVTRLQQKSCQSQQVGSWLGLPFVNYALCGWFLYLRLALGNKLLAVFDQYCLVVLFF